jgi:hypothetical protein
VTEKEHRAIYRVEGLSHASNSGWRKRWWDSTLCDLDVFYDEESRRDFVRSTNHTEMERTMLTMDEAPVDHVTCLLCLIAVAERR